MKKHSLVLLSILVLLSLLPTAFADSAVELFADNFDAVTVPADSKTLLPVNDVPDCKWISIDKDGDGLGWDYFNAALSAVHSKPNVVTSASYDNFRGAVHPDNWLVNKTAIQIPQNAVSAELELWYCGQDPSFSREYFELYAGTSQNPDEMTCLTPSGVTAGPSWKCSKTDLTAYAGKKIFIAVRHCNSYDQFRLNIDDLKVTAVLSDPPSTGDQTPLTLLLGILLISAFSMIVCLRKRRA